MRADRILPRFWSHVHIGPGCWIWTAYKDAKGYGRFNDGKQNSAIAHRFSWKLKYGPIPDGMCVLHRCDNPRCVNPAHLFLGTKADNNADRVKKGRSARGEKLSAAVRHGSRHPQSKLKEEDITAIDSLEQLGLSHRNIAAKFGVTQVLITEILSRKRWKHVPRDPNVSRPANSDPEMRGVHFDGRQLSGKKWRARIKIKGKQFWLGSFETREQARETYLAAKRALP